jgi:hypothetical protein
MLSPGQSRFIVTPPRVSRLTIIPRRRVPVQAVNEGVARKIAPPGERRAIHCGANARHLALGQHIAVVALF